MAAAPTPNETGPKPKRQMKAKRNAQQLRVQSSIRDRERDRESETHWELKRLTAQLSVVCGGGHGTVPAR